jgi:hypothetical protein
MLAVAIFWLILILLLPNEGWCGGVVNKKFATELRGNSTDTVWIYTNDRADSMFIIHDGSNWEINGGSIEGTWKGAFLKLGNATDGWHCWFRADTTGDTLLQYSDDSGVTWTALAGEGDMTAVNTTAPLAGGAASGNVTLTLNPLDSSHLADGKVAEVDLLIANGPVDEYALTWEADEGTGGQMKWEAQTGGAGTVDTTRAGAWLKVKGTAGDTLCAPADTLDLDTAGIVDSILGCLTDGNIPNDISISSGGAVDGGAVTNNTLDPDDLVNDVTDDDLVDFICTDTTEIIDTIQGVLVSGGHVDAKDSVVAWGQVGKMIDSTEAWDNDGGPWELQDYLIDILVQTVPAPSDNMFMQFSDETGTDSLVWVAKTGTGNVVLSSGPSFSGSPIFGGLPLFKNGATAGGGLDLWEDSDFGTNYIRVQAPTTDVGANYTLTLPQVTDTVSALGQTVEGDELGTGLKDSITNGNTAHGWGDHSTKDFADVLGVDPDGNDVDQTSLGKLEFFDAGLFLDADADGVMLISSDGTLELASNDWDISTTGTITNAEWQGTAIADAYVPDNITIDLATLATTVTVSDDESTADNHEVAFTTDNTNLESDGDYHYNPSTGTVTATEFVGGGSGLTGLGPSSISGLTTADFETNLKDTITETYDSVAAWGDAGKATDSVAAWDNNSTFLLKTGGDVDSIKVDTLVVDDRAKIGGRALTGNQHFRFNMVNPNGLFDLDAEWCIVPVTEAALTVTRIDVTCHADPTTELDFDLKWADAFIGLANAAVIDELNTTAGVTTITSGFDDATVAASKCIYILFNADPDAAITQVTIDVTYDLD